MSTPDDHLLHDEEKDGSDSEFQNISLKSEQTPSHIPKLIATASLCTLLLTFITVASYNFSGHQSSQSKVRDCGNNTVSARSLDCHFDPISFSWLPAPCFDGDLVDEFMASSPWKFYTVPDVGNQTPAPGDEALSTNITSSTETVPIEKVMTGEYHHLYCSWDYHRLHCTFMWRKMHRAMLGVREIDAYTAKYMHTRHCGDVLMKGNLQRGEGSTTIMRKFGKCGL